MSVLRFRSRNESRSRDAVQTGGRGLEISGRFQEDILDDAAFRSDLARICEAQNRALDSASRTAERYLREIAARPSKIMVRVAAVLGRVLYRRAYGAVHYNPDGLAAVTRLSATNPIVFLPSHRSNLDRPVMHRLLWENDLGPSYTAGGINMNFFPIGPISRRAGVFFIRRTFTNNPVYKLVLRTYFAYLVEQRLPLEWYMEGGRSRTGKLRFPRYGLLGYAADALAAGKSDDIYLVPTSINYDHVLEVSAYAAEQSGVTKEKETFGWLVKSVRSLRRRYGDIHIRFGEPVSMLSQVDPGQTGAARRQDLQRLASTVCMRINRITPVTPSSLVAVALLAGPKDGSSRLAVESTVSELVDEVESRNLPATQPLALLRTGQGLDEVAATLSELGIAVVGPDQSESPGSQRVYRIPQDQRLAASYYRNTIVHFFVTRAIAELALAAATRADSSDRPLRIFHEYVRKLGDLLAFEFFLPDHEGLIHEIESELTRHRPGWADRVAGWGASETLEQLRPHRAPWVLRSFLEAYWVVAEGLAEAPAGRRWNKDDFLKTCLGRGTEYAAQVRVAAESCSLSLFSNGVRVAGRRGLLKPGSDDLARQRTAFAAELRVLLELSDLLDASTPAGGPEMRQGSEASR